MLGAWWRRWRWPNRPVKRVGPRRRVRRRPLGIERLESRVVLSVDVAWAGPFALFPSVDVPAMARGFNQTETTVSVNPTAPGNIVAMANTREGSPQALATSFGAGLAGSWFRSDIGAGTDGLVDGDPPIGRFDGAVTHDKFGNVHATYLHRNADSTRNLVYALSFDGGSSWSTRTLLANSTTVDKPWIAAGVDASNTANDSVWITYQVASTIFIQGATVSALGNVGTFVAAAQVSNRPLPSNYAVPSVSPTGVVSVVWQDNIFTQGTVGIYVDRDLDGLGTAFGFNPVDTFVTNSNAGSFDFIPATPQRSHFATPYIAYDQTRAVNPLRNAVVNGKFGTAGRLYMVYVDEPADESNDNDILLRFSDNNGVTWSAPTRVNANLASSKFFPHISVDQANGAVFVGWLDTRNDLGDNTGIDSDGLLWTDTQYFGTVSLTGGASFLADRLISDPLLLGSDLGASNQSRADTPVNDPNDYGDYTGISAHGGTAVPVWPDNSTPGQNDLDVYTDQVLLSGVLAGAPVRTQNLTLTGSAGNDVYTVRLDATGRFLQIWENLVATGIPTYTASLAALNQIIVNGNDGNDELILDMSIDQFIPGGVVFNGGNGTDRFSPIAPADFVITNADVTTSGGVVSNVPITSVEEMNATGGSGSTFDITNWTTPLATINRLTAVGGRVIGDGDGDFTFSDTALTITGATPAFFQLAGISIMQLTGSAGNNIFTSNNWSGQGGLLNALGGNDTLNVTSPGAHVLTDTSIAAGPALFLINSFEAANLTGSAGVDSFDVGGWNGGGPNTVRGLAGRDTISATRDVNFVLQENNLLVGAVNFGLPGTDIEVGNLTGGASANTFKTIDWDGEGTFRGLGGADTFDIDSWGAAGTLDGGDADDLFQLADGNIDLISDRSATTLSAGVNVIGGAGNDRLTITDSAFAQLTDYDIGPTGFEIDYTASDGEVPALIPALRAFDQVLYDGTLERLEVIGGTAANIFLVRPSLATLYDLTGGPQAIPNALGAIDFLGMNFLGTTDRVLTPDPFNPAVVSTWTFGSGHRTVTFRQFEDTNDERSFIVAGSEHTVQSEPRVKIYDAQSLELRSDFLAGPAGFRGGVRVVAYDINPTGVPAVDLPEIFVAQGITGDPIVRIYRLTELPDKSLVPTLQQELQVYAADFRGGMYIAVGNVLGDARPELVVVPSVGVVDVRVFTFDGANFVPVVVPFSTLAYPETFINGARVSVGNLQGDAHDEVIITPGAGFQMEVRVFDLNAALPFNPTVVVVDAGRFDGAMVAVVGDLNRDTINELIVTTGRNGGSQIFAYRWSDKTRTRLLDVFNDASDFSPPAVVQRDFNGDQASDIFVAQGIDGRVDELRAFRLAPRRRPQDLDGRQEGDLDITDPTQRLGINLG